MSIKGAIKYDKRHIIFSNFAHGIGGFGLALLLQDYFQGHAFISIYWGWFFIAVSALEHLIAWFS